MAITCDFHLHSSFSGDGEYPMEEMIKKGISLGLSKMCFTEHNDYDFPESDDLPADTFLLNTQAYKDTFFKLKEAYADQITLLLGVELGLQPHLSDKNNQFSMDPSFDFIIGSSHLCNGKDPYYSSFYEGRSQEDAYLEYFESILSNIEAFDGFDVYGHLDYVVRYGPKKDTGYGYEAFRDIFDAILKRLISKGKGIELNTGGLYDGLSQPHPCFGVLKRYRELGGEIITIGSDAHSPDRIAYAFSRACTILKDCGFSHYTTFEKHSPSFHPL